MTLYDIVMISLTVIGVAGTLWATAKLEQARKAGKIRYIGKVRVDNEPK